MSKGHPTLIFRYRLKLCAWMLQYVNRHYSELLAEFVMDKANEIAVGATMAMLDSERLTHCEYCPQRFGLKKVGTMYRCLNHSREEKALVA